MRSETAAARCEEDGRHANPSLPAGAEIQAPRPATYSVHSDLRGRRAVTKMSRLLVSLAILFFFHGGSAGKNLNRQSPSAADDDLEVVFVTVIYRHGDRTPVDVYPTDPYKDRSNW